MDTNTSTQGWFTPGQEVAGLRIERFLGRGAFSTVYLARDVLIDRVVALKVLHPTASDRQRPIEHAEILTEARLIGKLSSPHIVTLYRVHPPGAEGLWMFEMQYLEGGSLEAQLDGGRRLPWGQARPLMTSVTAGLHDAHKTGVVHGDVKAGNVLLTLDGSARLADFGLARLVGDARLKDRDAGSPRGTPLYMAPEILLGKPGDAASDIWSLGVLLYRTLAGHFPFEAEEFRVLFHAVQAQAPRTLGPDVPSPIADLVSQCLAKQPEDRPSSAGAILGQLDVRARSATSAAPDAEDTQSSLIGRDDEVAKIRDALDQGENVMITGAVGIGRSALLAHLAATGRARGETWIQATVPVTEGLLLPLFDALRDALGADAARYATEERFGTGATLLREVLERGIEQHRSQGPWILRDLLRVLSEANPTVLTLDDVHQLDEEDTALLATLHPVPCRVIFTCGDEHPGQLMDPVLQAVGGGHLLRRVHLDGLPPESIYALLEAQAEAQRVDAAVADRIIQLAGGSPLFALELLRHLQASDGVRIVDGVLVPGDAWDKSDLPQRLQDVAARRLAALSPADRELLDVAAVDGSSFDGGALAALTGQPLLDVLRSLQRVYREHGIVVPQEHGYRFAHPVLRDAVYDHVAPEMRRTLHLALAEHLEARQDRHPVDPARIGEHWSRAGEDERARPHLIAAMGQAAKREELRYALRLAEQAGIRPSRIDADLVAAHLDDLLGLAHAYHQAGATEEVQALYERLRELTAGDADEMRLARVLAHAAWTRYATVGLEDDEVEVLRRLAASETESEAGAQALAALGRHALEQGEYDEAGRRLREADAAWARLGTDREQGTGLLLLAIAARRTGKLEEAEQLFIAAGEANRRVGHRLNAIICDVNQRLTQYERGSTTGVERGLVRAIHQFELLEAVNQANQTRCILASVRYAQGDAAGAIAVQEDVLARAVPLQYLPVLTMSYPNLARWRLASGDFERAAALRKSWGTIHERADPTEARCEQAIFDARFFALRGDCDRARSHTREAVKRMLALKSDRTRVRQIAALAEGLQYGAPETDLGELARALDGVDLPEDPTSEFARALLGAAIALSSDEVDSTELRAAAVALRASASAEGRAIRLCTAGWLMAEAACRAGDPAAADAEANRALAAAVALQNVWLQMHLLGVLARVHPGDVFDERREALIRHVGQNLAVGEARDRFVAFWSSGDSAAADPGRG